MALTKYPLKCCFNGESNFNVKLAPYASLTYILLYDNIVYSSFEETCKERGPLMKVAPCHADCGDIELLYDAYYHDALPPDVKEAFEAHLHSCECCQMVVGHYAADFDRRWKSFFRAEPDVLEGTPSSTST